MPNNVLKHIAAINCSDKWFADPFLPVIKKGSEFPILGVIHKDKLTTVKQANLFLLPLTKKEFDKLRGWDYESVEALVNDGWEVD